MDAMRNRNELLVEEVLQVQSNSKIFCNDQLTPHFAELFQIAWKAKKEKQLYSASSLGGRIKVRKTETSSFIIVKSESHLLDIIDNIDSSAPAAEISPNKRNESPHSIPSNSTKPNTSVQSKNQSALTQNANISHLPPSSSREARRGHHISNRRPNSTAPSTDYRNPNRSHQWQQMRTNHQHHNDQNRNGHRYRQQDRGRQIELSPNQYHQNNINNNQSYMPPPPHRNTNRNYSNRRYNEY